MAIVPVHNKGPGVIVARLFYEPQAMHGMVAAPAHPLEQHFLNPGQYREFDIAKFQHVKIEVVRPGP